MGAPKKYEREFVERAVRMHRDRLAEGGDSKLGARRHVGSLLDLNPATLRNLGLGRRTPHWCPAAVGGVAGGGLRGGEVAEEAGG